MLKQIAIFMLMGRMLTTYVDIKKTIVCEDQAGCLCEKDKIPMVDSKDKKNKNPIICSFKQTCNLNTKTGPFCSESKTENPFQYFKCEKSEFCFCNFLNASCRKGEYCIKEGFRSPGSCSLKDPSTFKDELSFIVQNKENTERKYCSKIGGCICESEPKIQGVSGKKWTVAFNQVCGESDKFGNNRHTKVEFSVAEYISNKKIVIGDSSKDKSDPQVYSTTSVLIDKGVKAIEKGILDEAIKNSKEWKCTEDFCKCSEYEDCPRDTYCLLQLKYPVCAAFSIAAIVPRPSKSSVVGSITIGDTCNSELGCLCNDASGKLPSTICSKYQVCVNNKEVSTSSLSCQNQKSRAEFQCVSGNCFCGGVSRLCNKNEFCRSSVRNFCTPNSLPQIKPGQTCEKDVGCTCQLENTNSFVDDSLRVVCSKNSVCQKNNNLLECVVKEKVNFECLSDLFCPCGALMCARNKFCSIDKSTQDCSFWPHNELSTNKIKQFIDSLSQPEISSFQSLKNQKTDDDDKEDNETLFGDLFKETDEQKEKEAGSKISVLPSTKPNLSQSMKLVSKKDSSFKIKKSVDDFSIGIRSKDSNQNLLPKEQYFEDVSKPIIKNSLIQTGTEISQKVIDPKENAPLSKILRNNNIPSQINSKSLKKSNSQVLKVGSSQNNADKNRINLSKSLLVKSLEDSLI